MPVAGADRLALARPYRGPGPDRARPRHAAAGGRSQPRLPAQEPAARARRGRAVRARLGPRRGQPAGAAARAGRGRSRAVRRGLRRGWRGWLQRADFMPPFEFYAWVLGADGGRRRLLARLGPDAVEPIEAFLGQTLAYEQGHPAAHGRLPALAVPRHGRAETRSREGTRRGARRPPCTAPRGWRRRSCSWPMPGRAAAPGAGACSGATRGWTAPASSCRCGARPSAERDGLTEAIAAREDGGELEERRRLLYVALTRARDRLYVTGWLSRRAARSRRRADDQEPSLARAGAPGAARQQDGRRALELRGRRRRCACAAAWPPSPRRRPLPLHWPAGALPAWSRPSPPAERAARAAGADAVPAADDPPPEFADRRRGRRPVPARAPGPSPAGAAARAGTGAARRAAADRLLGRPRTGAGAGARAELAQSVLDLLARPDLAAVFGPGQPGRAADLRRDRRPGDRGPDRPAGGHRGRGAGGRPQEQPHAAGDGGGEPGRLSARSSPPTATLLAAALSRPPRRARPCSGPRRRGSTRCRRSCSTGMRRQA